MTDPTSISPLAPLESRTGESFAYRWTASGFGIGLSSLHEGREGIEGEVVCWIEAQGKRSLLHNGRVRLLGTNSKRDLARHLGEQTKSIGVDGKLVDWRVMIETACARTIIQYREGDPVLDLSEVEAKPQRYLIEGIIPEGRTSLLVGDGASAKSFAALTMGLCIALGRQIGPFVPTQKGPVLYLDAETEEEEQAERATRICMALGLDGVPPGVLHYQRIRTSLSQARQGILKAIQQTGAKMVILDSAGAVAGGSMNDDQVAIGLTNALRTLGDVTRLLISHVSKATAGQTSGRGRVYGNVFFENYARSVLEARREGKLPNDFLVGIYHRKVNRGALRNPFAMRLKFVDPSGPISIESANITESTELSGFGGTADTIVATLLANGSAMSFAELQEETGIPRSTLQRQLKKLPTVHLVGEGGGRGNLVRVILKEGVS